MAASKKFRTAGSAAPDDDGLRSASRALALLSLLAEQRRPIGVTQVADALQIAPSSAHRLLSTLVASGFARRTASRRYGRGHAMLRLVGSPLALPMRLRELARPVLTQLAHETNETAHLAVLDGVDVVALDNVVGPRPVVARHPIGSRLPAHATAVGLAILAHVPEAVDAILQGGLEPLTGATIVEPRSLMRALETVRRQGYAVNMRGWHPETAGVAAAIFGGDGECVAAVGVSGPASRIGRGPRLADLAGTAVHASKEISSRLMIKGDVDHFDGLADRVAG